MTEQSTIQVVEGGAVDAMPAPLADPMISMIERIALDPNADLDKLERMLAMKERLDAQNAKVAFAHALSAARADMPPIIKDATVDFTSQKGRTHYQHETLAGIAKAIDPILSSNGLSYRFWTNQADGRVLVTCIISHRCGHSEETTLAGSPDQSGSKNSFQAVGSAVTYLQRYTLKAALGLSAEVDDDGQGAASRQDAPAFNAKMVTDRIVTQIDRAQDLSRLADIWAGEADNVKAIRGQDGEQFDRLMKVKEAAKARLSKPVQDPGADLMDEIPY